MLDLTANIVFADGPSTHPHQPQKSMVRRYFRQFEDAVGAGLSNGGLIYDTKASMDADLAHDANASAWVMTGADSGIYRKSGASGAGGWTKIASLPYSYIAASNVGTGTADAIQAGTDIPVPAADGAALIALPIAVENSASPVTVSFNGGTPLTIKTASGNNVAPGGLKAGMIVSGYVSGSTFRLLSDQASAAIQAAAEAAAVAAAAEAADALDAKMAAESAAGANLSNADSRAAAIATNIPAPVNYVRTAGYAAAGDGGGALYRRGNGDAPGGFHSADGAGWELAETLVKRASFGGGAPAQNTAALLAAMSGFDTVEVSPGVYDPIDLSRSGVTLHMTRGAVFRLPDDVVHAGDITTPHVVLVSGDDIKIVGDIVVDGNSGGQDLVTLPGGARTAAYQITGHRHRVNGTINITDACWQGIASSAIDLTGNEPGTQVQGLFVDNLVITNPRQYATLFWNLSGWEIGTIEVRRGAASLDARIRTGVQTSSVTETAKGKIGTIRTNDSVVLEARTNGLQIGSVQAAGLKTEDNSNIQIGLIDIDGSLRPDDIAAFSFAINNAQNIDIDTVRVRAHKSTETVVVLSGATIGAKNVSIGSIDVTGTIADVKDMMIRRAQNVQIGSVKLTDPVGEGQGFFWDYDPAYAPQNNVHIGSLISTGHVGTDITTENGGVLSIGQINPDASVAGILATELKYAGVSEAIFTVTLTATSGTIGLEPTYSSLRYYRLGRLVFLTGELRVSTVSSPTGNLTLTGLPFPASNNPQKSGTTTVDVTASGTAANAGRFSGRIEEDALTINIGRHNNGAISGAAADILAGSRLYISGCYVAAQ